MKFGLILRAYAPFKVFGGIFHGDNRGPTPAPETTSRVKAWVVFDPVAGTIETPHAKSDESSTVFFPNWKLTEAPQAQAHGSAIGKNTVHLHLHATGANPFLHMVGAPPIDMRLIVTASLGPRRLSVNGSLSGDQFPNVEAIMQDEAATRRTLCSYETDAGPNQGPFARLWGNRNAHMFGICKSFTLNEQGRFQ